jgi:excisionase family DNA binding protein
MMNGQVSVEEIRSLVADALEGAAAALRGPARQRQLIGEVADQEGGTSQHSETGQDQRLLVNVQEAAKLLGLGRTNVYALIGRGEIPTILIGRRRLISTAALADWVNGLSQR